MDRRLVVSDLSNIQDYLDLTWMTDRSIESSWSRPNVPLLIFADSSLPGSSVSLHGGPVATGTPVQLLFWGSWWSTPEGSNRVWMIEERMKAIVASDYCSELGQYGVSPPHFRGSLIVSIPAPPMSFPDSDAEHAPGDMIVDLIENDLFPDPDDEQIAYLVFMPKGFTAPPSNGGRANGAHTTDYDYEFPFDKDWFWWAWIRHFDDNEADDTTRTASHELTELLTDPDTTGGWFATPLDDSEIADAANVGGTYQTAWVNGAKVSAYWSNRHSATVIPIDRDYRARIVGSVGPHRGGRHKLDSGTFRPDPGDLAFCPTLQECCIEDRDYEWDVYGINETATLRVETRRYRQPVVNWTINGQPASGKGSVTVPNADTARYNGRSLVTGQEAVTVQFTESNGVLEIKTDKVDANFDLPVGCSVRDGSTTGNVRVDVIASPSVVIGFVGSELVLDWAYVQARDACHQAISNLFKDAEKKTKFKRPRPGDQVELDPSVLVEVPAWARLTEFERARQAIYIASIAEAKLPRDAADTFIHSLVDTTPALQAIKERVRNRHQHG
jgi:hypothetical protein